jgi:hypothetical protein
MAARTPRRSFATPFVVTLAAAPACYVQSSPGPTQPAPQQPPPTQTTTTQAPPDQQPPPTVMVNPPRPTQPAQPAQPTQPTAPTQQSSPEKWTVFQAGNGCQAAVKTECPKGVMCNPPPPIAYACPTNTTLPLTLVTYDGGQTCSAEVQPVKCPEGAVCNPPRPRQYPCPKR